MYIVYFVMSCMHLIEFIHEYTTLVLLNGKTWFQAHIAEQFNGY